MNTIQKSGYVAIVGRPNVGKSTLLNYLVGQKVSIISPKPQTTRHQILGIKTVGNDQAVFIDTPGLHQAERKAMNRYMNRLASSVIQDADLVLFMIEANRWTEDDEMVLKQVEKATAPVILVINKMDKIQDKSQILPFMDKLKEKFNFASIIPVSLKKKDNIQPLEKLIFDLLPEGLHLFPDEQVTDKDPRFQAAELIREKLIKATEEELPYSTTVLIDSFDDQDPKIIKINAIIYVEREGQKPIVIGKNGEMLKKIGTQARKEMELIFKRKVFLRLWVKVKSDWTDNDQMLQTFGYN